MAQIYLGRDEMGKKQYKSIYAKSPAELKEKETEVRIQLGQGLDILSQRDGFGQWADDFLRTKKAASISEGHKAHYEGSVAVWKEEFQGLEIGQIRTDEIERVFMTLQAEGYATRTVKF